MAFLIRPRIVTYATPDGRKCDKGSPGGVVVRTHAAKWYGQGIPGLPRKKRVPLCTGKAAAQRMLDDLVRRAERGQVGIPEDAAIEPLIVEWGVVVARKASEKHVAESTRHVRAVFAAAKIRSLADLRSRGVVSKIETVVFGLIADGNSPRTAAKYGKACKGFTRWLWRKKGHFESDPLAGVSLPNQAPEQPRRDLTPAELATLLDTAAESLWIYRGLAGTDRAILYLTAAATGLRKLELSRLTPASFVFGDLPRVTLPAPATKNKRAADQPLPPAVANRIAVYLQGRPAKKAVWPGTWVDHSAEMLGHDLAEAGIPVKTSEGRAVFHSLRHSFVSMLAQFAPISVVRDLARHESISTTNIYAHAGADQKRAAVDALPLPGQMPLTPLSHLSRSDLEGLVAGLAGLLAISFVPRLVPTA